MRAFILTFCIIVAALAKTPPVWPKQYHLVGQFDIPYGNMSEPVECWYDAINNRQKLSYYGGMDVYNFRYDIGVLYQVVPRIDTMTCFQPQLNGTGPLVPILPDLSNFTYIGYKHLNNKKYDLWRQVVPNLNRTSTYDMYINDNGQPHALIMYGYDFVFGSHPDLYIFYYKSVIDTNVTDADFVEPDVCKTNKIIPANPARTVANAKALLGRLNIINPTPALDDFESFMRQYRKFYFNEEIAERRAQFEKNQQYIAKFNANSKQHKLGVNHFADMSEDEMRTIMRPQPATKRSELKLHNMKQHTMSGAKLPSEINWIEAGAVTPVKDQGACGSCWTFGTTGALEGAYWMKTKQLISLSEQQIVDCAWVSWGGAGGNSGCDGGFASGAMEWVMSNGGIALEKSYPYLMQDHYCKADDKSSGVTITGYVNVTSFDEQALMDAVANHGPVAIAIDASHPSFTFHQKGVYFEPDCKNDLDSLDHEVLVVGYGTTKEGIDYWLVKNSWSTHWADNGYIKMARNHNNQCGVASQATYAYLN